MYLLSQGKNGVWALEPGRQLGVSPDTAWLLKHKLMQVMVERDEGRKLRGEVQVEDPCLGSERPGGKRGRGSASKTPFLAAVQVTSEAQPEVMKLGVVEGFRRDAVDQRAGEDAEPGTTVNTGGPGCFTGIAAAGC